MEAQKLLTAGEAGAPPLAMPVLILAGEPIQKTEIRLLSKEQWIEQYGGQALLDREGFEVVPCIDCDDSICHGWRVVPKQHLKTVVIEAEEPLTPMQKWLRDVFGSPTGMLSPHDVLLMANEAMGPGSVYGRDVLLRASDYLESGESDDPGRSTRQFDPEVNPYFDAEYAAKIREESSAELASSAVIVGPKPGDLFTTDRVTFHEVTNPELLVAERSTLVIHIPDGADWKTAVWEYVKERDLSIQIWDANGIPTPIGPAD